MKRPGMILTNRKKRSRRNRRRTKKDKHRKHHKKKNKDNTEKHKPASRNKKRSLNDKNHLLKAEFKARRRKRDIIFVIFIVLLTLSMFGGYFLYEMYYSAGDKEATSDIIEPNNENSGAPNKIEWHIYNDGIKLSKSNNKPVMIDFYFDGCHWCDELDKNTYSDSRVIDKAKSFISIKVDTYETNAYNGHALASQFNVQGCPTIVFLDAQENEVNRVGGYEDANQFLADMDEALNKS